MYIVLTLIVARSCSNHRTTRCFTGIQTIWKFASWARNLRDCTAAIGLCFFSFLRFGCRCKNSCFPRVFYVERYMTGSSYCTTPLICTCCQPNNLRPALIWFSTTPTSVDFATKLSNYLFLSCFDHRVCKNTTQTDNRKSTSDLTTQNVDHQFCSFFPSW